MSNDAIERAANAALTGSVKMVVPGSGLVLDVFKAIVGDKDAAFHRALVGELHEHVNRLQATVDRLERELRGSGSRIDELDPIARAHVMNDFLQDVAATPGVTKRKAVTEATAKQFDPRVGSFSLRQHWLGILRSLSELEIEALKLHASGTVFAPSGSTYIIRGPGQSMGVEDQEAWIAGGCVRIEIGAANVALLRKAVRRLVEADPPLVLPPPAFGESPARVFSTIEPAGRSLLAMIDEVPPLT